jgi:hypothetical protein
MKSPCFILILTAMFAGCPSCESDVDDSPPIVMDLAVTVFDAESGDAIRGASLTLRALGNPGQTINPNSSDDSGKYVFRSLETGKYDLYVEKTGYIPNETPLEVFPNKTNETSISITRIHD